MRRLVLRFGWVRSIAAALTAAGVAVVFVVLIVPTAFGSSKAARAVKGGCGLTIKGISTDKVFRSAAEDEEKQYTGAIYGAHLGDVDTVQFGEKGRWVTGSFTFIDDGGGYLLASPEPQSVGVKGRIRVIDYDPNPDCYAVSPSQFTPKNTGADS